jgi:hypothetical protein
LIEDLRQDPDASQVDSMDLPERRADVGAGPVAEIHPPAKDVSFFSHVQLGLVGGMA